MKTILLLLACLCTLASYGQITADSVSTDSVQQGKSKVRKDTRPFNERVGLGGSLGFWINPTQMHLEVSPMLAYRFPKILTVGTGYRYIYIRSIVYGKNLNNYGPNLFARAQLTRRFYLWSEWEYLNTEYTYKVANQEVTTKTDHVDSFFGGLGYIRQIGKRGRGGISLQVLYNFLYNREDNSPYYSPVTYRVGYFF